MPSNRHDVGIRVRADEKFRRLIDRAAQLTGKSRSEFIRDAAIAEAALIINGEAIQRPFWIRPLVTIKNDD